MIPMDMRSKAWICNNLTAEIVGSNAAENMDAFLFCVLRT